MTVKLNETATGIVRKGNRWKVVIAAPGQGSSGFYTSKILKEQGPAAVPAGTKSWIGHNAASQRDPRDQLGKFPDGAYYDDLVDLAKYPEGALVAELDVFSKYKQTIEDIGTDAELSIFMDGDVDQDGNVISMIPSRTNSVDLVAYGGLVGSGLIQKMYESIRDSDKPTDESSAVDKKKEVMLDKETLDAITASVKLALADLAEAPKVKTEAEVQAEIDAKVETEVGAKVDEALAGYEEKVAAINAAELLPSQVESLKAEARKGVDVTPLIESAKKIVAEAKSLQESVGGFSAINEDGSNGGSDFTVGRWND